MTSIGVEEKEGVIIHKLESKAIGIGYARILKGLYETIEKIKPDIVHVHNLHPSLFQLARWKEKLGYKLVAELHHPAACTEKLSARLALPLTMLALSIGYGSTVDTFIAHTELERKWLTKWGINNEKIVIVRFPALPGEIFSYAEKQDSRRKT